MALGSGWFSSHPAPTREIFLYRDKKGLKWILIGDSYRKIYSIGKYFPIVGFLKRPMRGTTQYTHGLVTTTPPRDET